MPPKSSKAANSADSINNNIALVIRSGKYALGYKQALRNLRQGDTKYLLVSSNCPIIRKSELEYYSMLAKTKMTTYLGTSADLGRACGKYYGVSVMSIMDEGDSNILQETKVQEPVK